MTRERHLPGLKRKGRDIVRWAIGIGFVLGIPLASGCNSFNASDVGDSKTVLIGKYFIVALPTMDEPRVPQIMDESIARFDGFRRNSAEKTDVFEFKATKIGLTEIHIPWTPPPDGPPEFTITIKVVLGGSPNP